MRINVSISDIYGDVVGECGGWIDRMDRMDGEWAPGPTIFLSIYTRMPSLICIISPAKSLATVSKGYVLPTRSTWPQFLMKTDALVGSIRSLKATNFKTMMGVSPAIASRTEEEYRSYHMASSSSASDASTMTFVTQAGLLFDGPAYRGLDCASLAPEDMDVCQECVRFLSGLYGWLRPADYIQAHRLEMGTKGLPLPINTGKTLYEHWGLSLVESVEEHLAPSVTGAYQGMLLNCASEEYFKVIQVNLLAQRGKGIRIVTCAFTDKGRVVSVFAKRARGLMARFISTDRNVRLAMTAVSQKSGGKGGEEKLLETIKAFSLEGYAYVNSSEDAKTGILTLHFNRAGAAPVKPTYEPAPGSASAVLRGDSSSSSSSRSGSKKRTATAKATLPPTEEKGAKIKRQKKG